MAAFGFHVVGNRGKTRSARLQDTRNQPVPIHVALPPKTFPERSGTGGRRPHSCQHKTREESETGYFEGRFNAVLRAASRRGAGSSSSDPRAPGLQRGEADPASLRKDF